MSEIKDRHVEYLIKAVNPSLFTVAHYPDIIISLVLANIMSPKLWELVNRIFPSQSNPISNAQKMKKLHKFVNDNFYHPDPVMFSHIWGLYEREAITDAEERSSSNRAMSIIMKGFEKRYSLSDNFMLEFLKSGAAPRYVYPTIDIILAYAPILKDIKKHSLGITSCLDECILIASLAIASGCCGLNDIIFVGSPWHYTLYIFPDDEGYMFNAKREFFSRQDWFEQNGGDVESSKRMFIDKLFACDRIISSFGYCVFPGGPVNINFECLENIANKISRFLFATPPEILQALETAQSIRSKGFNGEAFTVDIPMLNSGAFEAYALHHASGANLPYAEAALYAFRHPNVKRPELYKEAAMRGFKSYILSGAVLCYDDAVEIAEEIVGRESIYGSTSRIAMPDETLVFNKANDEERALLIETLMRHSSCSKPQ